MKRSAKLAIGLWLAAVGGGGAILAFAIGGGSGVATVAIALVVTLLLAGVMLQRTYTHYLKRQMEWTRKYRPPDV